VGHHTPVELLTYQIGRFAAQDELGSAQMGLQFVERGFDLPTFVIKRRQFLRRRFFGIEDERMYSARAIT